MPHVWTIAKAFGQPAQVNQPALITILFHKALFTAKEAAVGFAIGAVVGFALGIVLAHSRLAPARLPAVHRREPDDPDPRDRARWSSSGSTRSCQAPLQGWGAVAVIAAYLTFFPVVINTLRGLQSADPRALELMRSYAAGRWAVLWKLRVPASLPYVFSALRIAATASVVGAIIGELPSGLQCGLGGAILNFNQYYSIEPQELWATNIVAALLGIVFFLARRRRRDGSSSAARRRRRHERRNRRLDRGRHEDVPARRTSRRSRTSTSSSTTGEFVSLIGPSGCGKSTLLRVIGDLIEPTAGTVTINGKPAHQARVDHDYGIVFQDAVLFDWRTVSKNIALPLEMLGWDRDAARHACRRCSSSSS